MTRNAEMQPTIDARVGLLDMLTAVGEEKKTIAVVFLFAAAMGLIVAFATPPTFTAQTTLLPPQQGQSGSSAMAASLGALAATAGVAGAFKTPEELYVGLLKTESISNALIDRFNLKERYEEPTLNGARKALVKRTRILADRKSTLISVEVDDLDATFSAQLANGFADELRKLLTRLAVTDAQQRRMFFEQQVDKVKNDFARAEMGVKQAQDRSGLISLDAQTQTVIGAAAQLRAQIVAREVQIQAMRPYAGPENPELKRLLSELSSMRSQLLKMEGGAGDANAGMPFKDTSEALGNVRLYRELKFQEAMYSAMVQQLQLAKTDEAREAPLIQQVDVALPPDRKSKPSRVMIVLVAAVLGLIGGFFIAVVVRAIRKMRADPDSEVQWRAVSRAWSVSRQRTVRP